MDWAYIDGFPEYMVSTEGEVMNIRFGRLLKPRDNGHGYLKVVLRSGGQSHERYVHHLVAAAFVRAYEEGGRVGHIDRDRRNNRADNLRVGVL